MAAMFSRRNLHFTLFEVLGVELLCRYPYFSAHDTDTFIFTLDSAAEIAEKIAHPAYVPSDRQPPRLEGGRVRVHACVHDFVREYAGAGLLAAPFPDQWGGVQLPKTIAAAAEFILGSAHNSLVMYTDLTKGAAGLIERFGTEAQKQTLLPNMLSGKWLATMCLTETQAGSSLSDIVTTAVPQSDGTYLIKGQKIFISAGDHDVSDNIIHLVLARIQGAPAGTKGISLFIVPQKGLENRAPNDVTSVAIYHKMGQRATPALHLEFGAANQCRGYLLGEANRGLPQMFQMMNGARLGVGSGGMQIASAAYYASLQYAKERPQGRRLADKSAANEPVPIIRHPDVRRMLLYQKALVEGGLSLILQCYQYLDLEKAHRDADPEKARFYHDLLELLTPVAKTYGAEMGFQAVSQGLQVLGGYGYTEDFALEQLLRDCRIMSLYEGTTGIQSQALLGRQVLGNEGVSLKLWQKVAENDLKAAQSDQLLKEYHELLLNQYFPEFEKVTRHLFSVAARGNQEIALADANLYMECFGLLNVGWQWLKHAIAAQKALVYAGEKQEDAVFYYSKIHTMQFYFHYEMPRLKGLFVRLKDDKTLTVFDETREVLL